MNVSSSATTTTSSRLTSSGATFRGPDSQPQINEKRQQSDSDVAHDHVLTESTSDNKDERSSGSALDLLFSIGGKYNRVNCILKPIIQLGSTYTRFVFHEFV